MPIAAPVVAAAAQVAASGINAYATGKMNRKTRKWSEGMAQQSRKWALEDQAAMNEYNDPSSQMERLRKAGLNPALVYGNGATTEAAPIRSTEQPDWKPETPDYGSGISNSIAAYVDTKQKEAQTNNLRAQNTVLQQEAILKAATTANVASQTATGQFDLAQKNRLADISAQAAEANLRKINQDIDLSMSKNDRETALASSSIQEAAARILQTRAQTANTKAEKEAILRRIEGLKKDNQLKQLDINLREKGINPSDPIYMRAIGQFLSGKPLNLPKMSKEKDDYYKQDLDWNKPRKN